MDATLVETANQTLTILHRMKLLVEATRTQVFKPTSLDLMITTFILSYQTLKFLRRINLLIETTHAQVLQLKSLDLMLTEFMLLYSDMHEQSTIYMCDYLVEFVWI